MGSLGIHGRNPIEMGIMTKLEYNAMKMKVIGMGKTIAITNLVFGIQYLCLV
jgi:hypothetical protein